MAHFEATVRVFDIVEPDATAARRAVEERLVSAGFSRAQLVHVALQGAITHAVRPMPPATVPAYTGVALLLLASVMGALWFLYLLAS